MGFVQGVDYLVFTGDLIDRGDFSVELIEYVTSTERVFSVIGNHEAMFLYGLHDVLDRQIHTSPNVGGGWINQYEKRELEGLADCIRSSMPVAITVEGDDYRIGVLHA